MLLGARNWDVANDRHLSISVSKLTHWDERELRPMPDRIAQLAEPFERRFFDVRFVEAHGSVALRLNKNFIENQ